MLLAILLVNRSSGSFLRYSIKDAPELEGAAEVNVAGIIWGNSSLKLQLNGPAYLTSSNSSHVLNKCTNLKSEWLSIACRTLPWRYFLWNLSSCRLNYNRPGVHSFVWDTPNSLCFAVLLTFLMSIRQRMSVTNRAVRHILVGECPIRLAKIPW